MKKKVLICMMGVGILLWSCVRIELEECDYIEVDYCSSEYPYDCERVVERYCYY